GSPPLRSGGSRRRPPPGARFRTARAGPLAGRPGSPAGTPRTDPEGPPPPWRAARGPTPGGGRRRAAAPRSRPPPHALSAAARTSLRRSAVAGHRSGVDRMPRPWQRVYASIMTRELLVGGFVHAGFEPVREAFVENFTHRGEIGGACCIAEDGEPVVDLWGG